MVLINGASATMWSPASSNDPHHHLCISASPYNAPTRSHQRRTMLQSKDEVCCWHLYQYSRRPRIFLLPFEPSMAELTGAHRGYFAQPPGTLVSNRSKSRPRVSLHGWQCGGMEWKLSVITSPGDVGKLSCWG
jgi:hypothetical protein